jgi:hypothetical protein
MRQRTIRRLVCPLVVGMLAFAVAGCNQENSAPLASLQALPEANLPSMPGATLILERSSPREWGLDSGWTPAQLDRRFGINIGPDTFANRQVVLSYYGSILKPRSWTDTCRGCGIWKKDGFEMQVSFQTVTSYSPADEKPYSIVFDELLQEDLYPSASGSPGAS